MGRGSVPAFRTLRTFSFPHTGRSMPFQTTTGMARLSTGSDETVMTVGEDIHSHDARYAGEGTCGDKCN